MDLFEQNSLSSHQPLAYRMRPRTLDEYIGQDHIVGKGRLLRRAIQADQLSSIILYGPPGTGKTTLARVIANSTKSHFSTLNAVLSGVKELRFEIDEARSRLNHYGKRTILFVDEVHRWNKSQQDALLPWVENGTCILIGATTENPFFEVNSALVSRSRIFQLNSLRPEDLFAIAQQALIDKERGYGAWNISCEEGALEHLVEVAQGDARSLLNALELAVETSGESFPPKDESPIYISKASAEESIQKKVVLYDKEGDYHFDVISAFIKSIRGSDPDATLYWLAKMVRAGEDPSYIFRRMLISACEDVGLADPQAIVVVQSNAAAFDRIGLPEGRFHLTHAALYVATAPKSHSTMAFFDALRAIEQEKEGEVPNHLKDGSRDKKGFGHGEGYLYPHAYQDHWVAQQYLPTNLQGSFFYHPSDMGYEKTIATEVKRRREAQLEIANTETFLGNISFSPDDKERERWIMRASGDQGALLYLLQERLFSSLSIKRHDRVLVLDAGYGQLVWEAFRRTPEGLVVGTTAHKAHYEHMKQYSSCIEHIDRPHIVLCDLPNLPKALGEHSENTLKFEYIIGRNVLNRLYDEKENLQIIASLLTIQGIFSCTQTIASESSRISHFIPENNPIKELLIQAEHGIYGKDGNPIACWNQADLENVLSKVPFNVHLSAYEEIEKRTFSASEIHRWIVRSYVPQWEAHSLSYQVDDIISYLSHVLLGKEIVWKHKIVLIQATHHNTNYGIF